MNTNNFHKSKIINKKIINSELCFIEFEVENWNSHIPGQYSEICLTAENGYQAIRPYSIASEPNSNIVGFLIEKISITKRRSPHAYFFFPFFTID